MGEMIERVAEAIALSGNGGTWDDWYNVDQKEFHRRRARAAIAAMREPTPEMPKAEMDLGGYGFTDGECYCADPSEIWRAMIDEALK